MKFTVHAFAQVAEIVGGDSFDVESEPSTLYLLEAIYTLYPALSGMSCVLACDNSLVTSNQAIGPSTAIALLPPFSGG